MSDKTPKQSLLEDLKSALSGKDKDGILEKYSCDSLDELKSVIIEKAKAKVNKAAKAKVTAEVTAYAKAKAKRKGRDVWAKLKNKAKHWF
jgi:hypothetical protein